MEKLLEIRWHGRGGQGVVTASELLAETALEDGGYFQAFPDYGSERMGAPIRAYTRISSSPIRQHCQISEPDAVVVFDSTLIGVVDFTEGLKDGGALVINTTLPPDEVRRRLGLGHGRVYTVDATSIALSTMKRNIPNTPMLGALLRAIDVVKKDDLIKVITERMGGRMSKEMVKANIEAMEQAFNETREDRI